MSPLYCPPFNFFSVLSISLCNCCTCRAPSLFQGKLPASLSVPALNPVSENKSSLSLTNEDWGFNGPLSLGATYSDLTHTFFNAMYVLPLSQRLAIRGLGEYGFDQYRLSGTLGYGTNLLNTTLLTFDSNPATNITPINDTTVTVSTPAPDPGVVDVYEAKIKNWIF